MHIFVGFLLEKNHNCGSDWSLAHNPKVVNQPWTIQVRKFTISGVLQTCETKWNKQIQTVLGSPDLIHNQATSGKSHKSSHFDVVIYTYVQKSKQQQCQQCYFQIVNSKKKNKKTSQPSPNLVQPPHQPRLCIRHQQPCQFHADWRQGCARNQQQTDLNCGHGWTWGLHLLYWGFINLMGCKEGEYDGM